MYFYFWKTILGQQRELQRYDVRNVINRKRAAKNGTGIGGRKSRSRSPRSRSPRSRSPRSRSSPRSASSPRRRNAIRHSRSPVPFGSGRLARRRKSKSRFVNFRYELWQILFTENLLKFSTFLPFVFWYSTSYVTKLASEIVKILDFINPSRYNLTIFLFVE